MPQIPTPILIIDDEKDLCEILKARFEKLGYNVTTAHDGLDGMTRAVEDLPACILLDVRMPKEDGFTFLRKLRSFRDDDINKEEKVRKIPVIILTAAGENMKQLFQIEGINDYMEKPFDFDILCGRIQKIIRA